MSDLTSVRPDQLLAYSRTTTYAEYLAASPQRQFLEMRRREIRLAPDDQLYFTAYPDLAHWLIVAADDSPDTLLVLPIIAHMAASIPRLTLRVVREEDAPSLLAALMDDADLLATLGDADLPLLISFDEEWHFQETWGPHPAAVEPYLDQWLADHPESEQLADDDSPEGIAAYARLVEKLLYEARLWYNSGLNHACVQELRGLLARWHDESIDEGEEA